MIFFIIIVILCIVGFFAAILKDISGTSYNSSSMSDMFDDAFESSYEIYNGDSNDD